METSRWRSPQWFDPAIISITDAQHDTTYNRFIVSLAKRPFGIFQQNIYRVTDRWLVIEFTKPQIAHIKRDLFSHTETYSTFMNKNNKCIYFVYYLRYLY